MLKYPHDIIDFSHSPANSNFDEFHRLYQNGLSLREVSRKTDFPVSTIRNILVLNKVPLRTNRKASKLVIKKPQRTFWGAISKILNGENIPSKFGKKWSDKTVASVIRRNKIESLSVGGINE